MMPLWLASSKVLVNLDELSSGKPSDKLTMSTPCSIAQRNA